MIKGTKINKERKEMEEWKEGWKGRIEGWSEVQSRKNKEKEESRQRKEKGNE